jgi:hypothetical protein
MPATGLLLLHLQLPGCSSLKEKRGRLKPLLARLHKQFNVSAAEVDHLDAWGDALLACALVSNQVAHVQRALQTVEHWVEDEWPDVQVVDARIEML